MTDLLKPVDVARLLAVTDGAVRRWVREGHLTAIKTPGGFYRIRREDAEALLAPRPIVPKPEAAA